MHTTFKVVIITVIALVLGFVAGMFGPRAYNWVKGKFQNDENDG